MDLIKSAEFIALGKTLISQQRTVAAAESVTAGAIQLALSGIPDAQRFFQGGITAYNVAQKFKHLGVEPSHALQVNCVSGRVAREMALGACRMFQSDWGIGISGYASPTSESGNQVFAFYCVVLNGDCVQEGKLNAPADEPARVQTWFANEVCARFADLVQLAG